MRRSRADHADPIPDVAAVLGGTLAPFQWAGVRYALDARQMFLADEQGLGKTVEALATLEADGAFPAVVVCPASMKLGWQREAANGCRTARVAVIEGRAAVPPTRRHHDPQLRDRRRPPDALSPPRPRALVVDESHYCKNPRAKRTQAVAGSRRRWSPTGCASR